MTISCKDIIGLQVNNRLDKSSDIKIKQSQPVIGKVLLYPMMMKAMMIVIGIDDALASRVSYSYVFVVFWSLIRALDSQRLGVGFNRNIKKRKNGKSLIFFGNGTSVGLLLR